MKFGLIASLALAAASYFLLPQKAEASIFHKKAKTEEARPANFLRMDADTLVTSDRFVVDYGPHMGVTTVTTHSVNGTMVREEINHTGRSADDRQVLRIKNDPTKGLIGRFKSVGSENARNRDLDNIYFWKPKADDKAPLQTLDNAARTGTLVQMMFEQNSVKTIIGQIAQAPQATAALSAPSLNK